MNDNERQTYSQSSKYERCEKINVNLYSISASQWEHIERLDVEWSSFEADGGEIRDANVKDFAIGAAANQKLTVAAESNLSKT
jgi:hypothetical protein